MCILAKQTNSLMKKILVSFISILLSTTSHSQVNGFEFHGGGFDQGVLFFHMSDEYHEGFLNQTRKENGARKLQRNPYLDSIADERGERMAHLAKEDPDLFHLLHGPFCSDLVGDSMNYLSDPYTEFDPHYGMDLNIFENWGGVSNNLPRSVVAYIIEEFEAGRELDLFKIDSLLRSAGPEELSAFSDPNNPFNSNFGWDHSPNHLKNRTNKEWTEFGYSHTIIVYQTKFVCNWGTLYEGTPHYSIHVSEYEVFR